MRRTLWTAGLIVLRNNKLLLAYSKNKQAWYLPGGKVDPGETAEEAIVREIKEELNLELKLPDLQYYYHITAPAFGERDLLMEQDCFLYELHEDPKPSAEIEDVRFFSLKEYRLQLAQVPGVLLAFERLAQDELLIANEL
ncbi:NUDIX hydrolase [Olivibacter sitiensis]|uniref:NUDIX hydrolase n=1 Tax=Olivibacter sitiensis TaxID=376470 RepID=UPI0004199E5F|nr:NUDIX domain-containing protein [Olivibacter sitiensis]